MLKRFPGSKVYRLPSSAIELPDEPFSVVSVAEPGCSSHATELYGFGVIRVALPLAFATPVADYIGVGPTGVQIAPYAWTTLPVGDTTRNGDVVIDRGHIDPVRNGDAFETMGYYDHFDRREGHGKVRGHSQLGR